MNDILDSLPEYDVDFDYQVFPLIQPGNVKLSRFGYSIDDLWGSRFHNIEVLLSARETYAHIRDFNPDVLHVSAPGPVQSLIAKAVDQQRDVKLVFGPDLGGWYPIRPSEYWECSISSKIANRVAFRKKKLALNYLRPDTVLTFSQYHCEMVGTIWDQRESIKILRPAVSPAFRPTPDIETDIDLLYVGEMSNQKGYPHFIEALERLDGETELSVVVVGGASEAQTDFSTIDVTHAGVVPRSELPEYYNRARLFVCLSSDEMGPNTLVEAFSCGTPAIVSDELGIREYLRDGNGRLCDREDVDDVVETMKAALADVDGLIANAEQAADSYDICRTIDQLQRIYAEEASEG